MRGREKVYYDFRSTPVVLVLALEDEPLDSLFHHLRSLVFIITFNICHFSLSISSLYLSHLLLVISTLLNLPYLPPVNPKTKGVIFPKPGDSKCLCLEILNALT